jgi:hypothetical protein
LRKQVWAVDANRPVVKVETMEEVVANSIWRSLWPGASIQLRRLRGQQITGA